MDLDGDGHKDILSGSYSRMQREMAGLFQVLRGEPNGQWKKAETLKGTDGEPLIIPIKDQRKEMTENICTRPMAVDWDGDGDLDLIVGNFAGSFYWFKGEGKGKFNPKPEKLLVDGKPLTLGAAHSDPFVIDWDGDGDLDLLSGTSSGGVKWSENVAKRGEKIPVLTKFRPLIKPGKQMAYGSVLRENDLTGPTTSTRIWVDDINGDGKLDILVGDGVTLLSPAKGLSEAEYKKRQAEWEKKLTVLRAGLNARDEKARAEANKKFSELYQKRREFVKEDRTGFVWLYLQK